MSGFVELSVKLYVKLDVTSFAVAGCAVGSASQYARPHAIVFVTGFGRRLGKIPVLTQPSGN